MLETTFDNNKGLFGASVAALKRTPHVGSMLAVLVLIGLVPFLGTIVISGIAFVWAEAALTRDLSRAEHVGFSGSKIGLAICVSILSLIISLGLSWLATFMTGDFRMGSNLMTILNFFIAIMLNAMCIRAVFKGKLRAFFTSRVLLLVKEDWATFMMVALLEFILSVLLAIVSVLILGACFLIIPNILVPSFDFLSLAHDFSQGAITQQIVAAGIAVLVAWLFISTLVNLFFLMMVAVSAAWVARTDSPEICFACYAENATVVPGAADATETPDEMDAPSLPNDHQQDE